MAVRDTAMLLLSVMNDFSQRWEPDYPDSTLCPTVQNLSAILFSYCLWEFTSNYSDTIKQS